MGPFRDLQVWQRAHALALRVYRETAVMPESEKYGITSQLRRAAVSVPTNLAEGSRRSTDAEFARMVNIAEGSMAEVEYLLQLSSELGLMDPDRVAPMRSESEEISRMLAAFRRTLVQSAEPRFGAHG